MWFHLNKLLLPIVWCCPELRKVSVGLFQPEFLSLFSAELHERAGLTPWWLHGIQLHLHPALLSLLSPFHPLYVLISNCQKKRQRVNLSWKQCHFFGCLLFLDCPALHFCSHSSSLSGILSHSSLPVSAFLLICSSYLCTESHVRHTTHRT